MKQSKLFLTACLLSMSFFFQPNLATAVVGSVGQSGVSATIAAPNFSKKETRKLERLGKRLEKMMAKKAGPLNEIGLEDPAKTWLKRWLVCWGVAIVIGIVGTFSFGALWYLSGLFWTLGSICAIIWLLKYLEAI